MKINFNFNKGKSVKSVFINDDYIAPILSFDDDENVGHFYIEIKNGETELADISFNSKTKELSRFQLVGCTKFENLSEDMIIPIATECSICINSFNDSDNYGVIDVFPEKFITKIYKNGLCTFFSDDAISCSMKSGNLIFSFDAEMNLIRIYIINLNTAELDHIKEVLQNG